MSIATKNINAEKIQGNLSINSITANTITATTISASTYSNLPSPSITVGTTPVTSGIDGRVLMQRTGKVENSIIYENGLGDVIIPTVSSGAIRGLVVGGTTRNSNMALTLYNSLSIKTGGALYLERSDGQNNLALGYSTTGFNLTIGAPASSTGFIYFNKQNGNNIATFDVNLGHFGIGTTSPQARLDVRAQGALSTDIAFRVRNSGDTVNYLVVNGAGDVYNNGAGGVTSNTFYGENVGRNATGTSNTFVGSSAGSNNSTGISNSFFGTNTGFNNTTGGSNNFFGVNAGLNNTTGGSNSFFGVSAGQNVTTGGNNSFFGVSAGQNMTTSNNNSFFGRDAGLNITTGSDNTFIGRASGRYAGSGTTPMTSINNSTYLGVLSRGLNATGSSNEIVIGYDVVGLGSNTTVVGNSSTTLFRPYGNVAIGADTAGARLDVRAQGTLSTDIAFRVRNSADTRNFLVVNGAGDVFNNGAGGVTSNTFYGENVGRSASGASNTAIGNSALRNTTTGNLNVAIGYSALIANTTGISNVAIGVSTLTAQTSAAYNTAAGYFSLRDSTGSNNSSFGALGLIFNTTGANNVAFGFEAGRRISGGANLTIANQSIFIGVDTRPNADNETNQIVIGHNAIGTGSNSVTLGNTSITRTNLIGQVVVLNTTAPAASITDSFQMYSNDITAGNAAPHFRTENGAIVKVYQETTAVAASTLVSNAGTAITDTDTFDGYTLKQVVKALRNLGVLQ